MSSEVVRFRVSFLTVFLLALVLIFIGLTVLSFHVALGIGVVMLPALAVVVGMLSRVGGWRENLLRHWVLTSVVIALIFLVPGHLIYRLATTPSAMFKRLVTTPIPESVENITKEGTAGFDGWIALSFDVSSSDAEQLLQQRPFQAVNREDLDQLLQERVPESFDLDQAEIYLAEYPGDSVRFLAVLDKKQERMCILYLRTQ